MNPEEVYLNKRVREHDDYMKYYRNPKKAQCNRCLNRNCKFRYMMTVYECSYEEEIKERSDALPTA